MSNCAIVQFYHHRLDRHCDVQIPLDITAYELVISINEAYGLGLATDDVAACYLTCENPIALLRGNRTLREIGLRNGSIIHFTR